MRRTAVAGIALLMVVLAGAGCSQAVVSPAAGSPAAPAASAAGPSAGASFAADASLASPDASAAPSVDASAPPSADPTPEPTPRPAPTLTPRPVRVAFTKAISPKRWPAKPFTVQAVASNRAQVKYTAKGPCTVTPKGGRVEIDRVGQCVITARTASGEPASASMTVRIRPAEPKIQFAAKSVRWTRPFSVTLKAKVSPSIPLKYSLVGTGSGPDCQVSHGKLTLTGYQPSLTTDCKVKVSAAKTSLNYHAPKPVVATIHVDFPAWDVEVVSPDVVHVSVDGYQVPITVREHSGDALGITILQTGGGGSCEEISSTPQAPDPGTTTYKVVVEVIDPGPDGYVCEMTAKALPPDYFDPGGTPSDDFRLTVLP